MTNQTRIILSSKNRLTRRTVLRGLGGVTVGLPFLSAMLEPRKSHAQDATQPRFVVFYSPGGTLLDKWRPSGSETAFTLSNMMSPVQPFSDRLTFVDGLDLAVTALGAGHPHSRGMGGLLTGQPLQRGNFNTNEGTAGFADGPSIDQVIGERISEGLRLRSLEVSSAWSTGITVGGSPHPGNQLTYAAAAQPIPPATDPLDTLNRVFAGVGEGSTPNTDWNVSIMDAVADQYKSVSAQLGAEDRAKLEAHLTMIEEARQGLQATVKDDCALPTGINQTPGYYEDGSAGGISRGDLDGGADGVRAGAKVPEKGRAMTDILVSALACDVTRVGTMQWADSEAKFMMPFLTEANGTPLADHHHGYQHDRGFQPDALEVIHKWYAENFAYLLEKMAGIEEGNGSSMLDNSLVLWVTEIQNPGTHGQSNMPFVLAGGAAGQMPMGRWLQVARQPHNALLVSILNLFGVETQTFGHPDYTNGPLSGLV